MCKGLKDTGVLRMIKERPALIEILFPRSASHVMEPEVFLIHVFIYLFLNVKVITAIISKYIQTFCNMHLANI